MSSFILDTSAVCGLRRHLIESVGGQGHTVAISPVTFWERMCHLDEGEFQRAKGQVMKCQAAQILEDPFAEAMVDVGAASICNESRFEDRQAIPALLNELGTSESLQEFYSRQAPLRSDHQTLRNIIPQVRSVLDDYEQKYLAAVNNSAKRLVEEYGFQQAINLAPRQFVDEVALLAKDLVRDCRDAGIQGERMFGRILNRVFLARGYVLARTQQYLRAAGPNQAIVVDKNDTEDYLICYHLSCSSDRILVTNDGGTVSAVRETIQQLAAAYEGSQEQPRILAPVMNCEEFRTAVGG